MIPRLFRAWDRFWFDRISPLPLAACRLATGLLGLACGLSLLPELPLWLGDAGLVSRETAAAMYPRWQIHLMLWLPPGDSWVYLFWAAFMLASLALALGLFSRLSALLVFLTLLSMQHRNPVPFDGAERLLGMLCLYLTGSGAGADWSLDRWLRNHRSGNPLDRVPAWPLRLIQVNLALLYLSSFLSKLPGSFWLDGTAVYYSSRIELLQRFQLPYLFEHPVTVRLLTWGTLAIEGAFPVLVWLPRTRRAMLAAGVVFHLVMEYTMNIPLLQPAMLVCYVAFLKPEELDRSFKTASQTLGRWLKPEG